MCACVERENMCVKGERESVWYQEEVILDQCFSTSVP